MNYQMTEGKKLPGYVPDNQARLIAEVVGDVFCVYVMVPRVTRKDVLSFSKEATFTAVREGKMLYLAVLFDKRLGAESTFNIHVGAAEGMSVSLPRVEDLPEGQVPPLCAFLVDSNDGVVHKIRTCAPPGGFMRSWLAAIHEQMLAPYDQPALRAWADTLMANYPDIFSLARHPNAISSALPGR